MLWDWKLVNQANATELENTLKTSKGAKIFHLVKTINSKYFFFLIIFLLN